MGLWQEFFGTDREEIWRQLANQLNAEHSESFWTGGKVQALHGPWTITLDIYTESNGDTSTTYTRLRAPYVNSDGFQFNISRKTFFSDLALAFGMQDVVVGQPGFDDDFIIQGNDERKLRQLFANQEIRVLIDLQPRILLSVRGDQGWFSRIYPEGVDELYFQTAGALRDLERLKTLFYLFGETLDQLVRMGSAEKKDPGVTL